MNAADYYEVQTGIIQLMDSNLEFWMGATFAIVLAFHFAGKKISILMKSIVIFVYLTASILFQVRIMSLSSTFGELNAALIAAGAAPWPQEEIYTGIILILRQLLLTVGTLATVWYVVTAGKSEREDV